MKTTLLIASVFVGAAIAIGAPEDDLITNLQRGLFEEEANHNYDAAIKAYQAVVNQLDKNRKLAVTAIFRLGECYRKEGRTNEATACYERILHQFPDQPAYVKLSRDTMASMGLAPAKAAAPGTSEAENVARIRAIIKNSPDLINAPQSNGETLLEAAAGKGQLAVARLLLDNGAAVNGIKQPGLTPLHFAAANGHKTMVDLLLSKGANPNARTANGATPLDLAALKGYEEVAKSLVAAGAQVNAKTGPAPEAQDRADLKYHLGGGYFSGLGSTPLHLATASGNDDLVRLLISKSADVNAQDVNGRTVLSYAAEDQYAEIVKTLLAAKADPNLGSLDLPLAFAAFNGDTNITELLLHAGANPNLACGVYIGSGKWNGKHTALDIAVGQGNADVVEDLVRFKADPDGVDQFDHPLIYDALANPPVLSALLNGGANPNRIAPGSVAPGLDHASALLQAANIGKSDAVALLLAHGADPNAPDNAGDGPLHLAAGNDHARSAELLLKNGANINAQDNGGLTPLGQAVVYKHENLARLLLNHKADPNVQANDGETPLHVAVENRLGGIVRLLLQNHANPNIQDNRGQTPLHAAVEHRFGEIAVMLLQYKADPNVQDEDGHTPLDLAKEAGQGGRPGFGRPGVPVMPARPGRVWNPALGAWTTPSPEPKESRPSTLVQLLLKHGAIADMPRMNVIEVRRASSGYSHVVFTKTTNNWNHFTLFEAIAAQYGLIASAPEQSQFPNPNYRNPYVSYGYLVSYPGAAPNNPPDFPDLAHIHLRRPTPDLKGWTDKIVDLAAALDSGSCSNDVPLKWGDVIDIPETDHPVNAVRQGLPAPDVQALSKCLSRTVTLTIGGQPHPIALTPPTPPKPGWAQPGPVSFWLKGHVLSSPWLLTSSDVSRVKITRTGPATGKKERFVVDCSQDKPAPGFWLRNGDVIEVPEKP